MIRRDLHEANRLSWNEATKAHNSHKAGQAEYFRNGGNKLFPEEMELLGDVAGKDLVHLQCNAGQDSLSLVRLGAHVTGVDISDEAIAFARQLSADSGLPATFVRSDVFDWFREAGTAGQSFDLAFSSYGAIGWLSDLSEWAKGIAGVLRPGGRFVLVEFHPFAFTLDDDGKGVVTYPYASSEPLTWDDGVGDYVAASGPALAPSGFLEGVKDFRNPFACHEYAWSMADVVTALLAAGLRIEAFREYLYANGWKPFPGMRELPGRRTAMPEGMPQVPLMFAVVARKV